jgi:hypothetical protein
LVSVVAIASPLRVHEEPSSPGVVTLTHLASWVKPVNGFYTTESRIMETISDFCRSSPFDKTARNTVAVGIGLNFAVALASLQHLLRD